MITKEKYNNIRVGDRVKIVQEWADGSPSVSGMNYMLGKIFTVDRIQYVVEWGENDVIVDGWHLGPLEIDEVNPSELNLELQINNKNNFNKLFG